MLLVISGDFKFGGNYPHKKSSAKEGLGINLKHGWQTMVGNICWSETRITEAEHADEEVTICQTGLTK
jgi:hypothetical protein